MATPNHTRSHSWPLKSHPFTSRFDEHLTRLKYSESTSTSSASISNNLNIVQDLYDCVDNLLQLPLTQQSLSQEQHKKFAQVLLDGSVMLLDLCSTAKDSLLQIKESMFELQSVVRRRRSGEINSDEIKKYLNSRKVVKKTIHKTLRNLKGAETKDVICHSDEDHEASSMVNMLKEVETATFTVIKSLLSLITSSKAQPKLSGLSLVSKLMQSKKVACEKVDAYSNEFEKVDDTLLLFIGQKTNKYDQIFGVQNQLKDMEMCIQDLEAGIECLCRRLIKERVALLNILNN